MRINIIHYQQRNMQQNIRIWIVLFMIALILSGLTAMGVETQMRFLSPLFPSQNTVVGGWLWKVYHAVKDTNQRYPFMAYGFDWLAFAHIVIATAFIGPLKDPVRNKWVIQFGMIACCMVIPFAFFASYYRGLPIWWCAIDCSFGIIGFIPLSICLKLINGLEAFQSATNQSLVHSSTQPHKKIYDTATSNA